MKSKTPIMLSVKCKNNVGTYLRPFTIVLGLAVGSVVYAQTGTTPEPYEKMQTGPQRLRRNELKFEPSPDKLACDDCSTLPKGLNQYVISGLMDTFVEHNSGNPAFPEWLRLNTSWSFSGNTQILPEDNIIIEGQRIRPQHDYHTIYPGAYPGNPGPPEYGFYFDVRTSAVAPLLPAPNSPDGWKFPASNSGFGPGVLSHLVSGHEVQAPVALFYPSTEFQHPRGGLKGYRHVDVFQNPSTGSLPSDRHIEVDTPNWFYYYGLVFTAPYGTEINYRPDDFTYNITGSGYTDGQNHVHIGDNAHGGGQVELFAVPPGEEFVEKVGDQSYQGIDTFMRVVTHECTHKRMYDALRENLAPSFPVTTIPVYRADGDLDGVPDEWESIVGLDPEDSETIADWGSMDPGNGAAPDNEVFCRMTERDLYGDITQDWADDGLNWKGLAAYLRHLRCHRLGPPRQEDLSDEYKNLNLSWRDARTAASAPSNQA